MAEEDGSWKEALPDGIRSHPSLASLESVENLAKSWVNAQKLIGKEKLPLPSGPEDKEGWNMVFSRLGRPEKAESYEIDKTKVPAEIPIDDNLLTSLKAQAHALGFNPSQMQGLFDWWIDTEKGILAETLSLDKQERETAEAALRQEWGSAYDQNVKLATTLISKFGGNAAQELLSSSFANDSKVIKLLASIGKAMSEDTDLLGEFTPILSPAEAQIEINKIQGDRNHPYYKKGHPEHQVAVEHMESLFKLVYPEGKK